MKKEGVDAANYLQGVVDEGNLSIYEIRADIDNEISRFYELQMECGLQPSDPNKPSHSDPNAKVVDNYALLGNNCVTKTIEGINVIQDIIKTTSISPKGLDTYMMQQSLNVSTSENIIYKIDDIEKFINRLLQSLRVNEE